MSIIQIFILGIFAGITIGAPYGPSGILSLYRSIQYGWQKGFITAIGSLTAIFLFSFLAAIFIESMAQVVQDEDSILTIRLLMGIILFIIGVFLFYSNKKTDPKKIKEIHELTDFKNFISAFGIGVVSGKNVIGFPTFLIASQYLSESSNPIMVKALFFSLGSLFSSSILYVTLIGVSSKYGNLVFARILPFLKHFLSFFFIVVGIYLMVQYIIN